MPASAALSRAEPQCVSTCGANAPLTGHRATGERVIKKSKPFGVPDGTLFYLQGQVALRLWGLPYLFACFRNGILKTGR